MDEQCEDNGMFTVEMKFIPMDSPSSGRKRRLSSDGNSENPISQSDDSYSTSDCHGGKPALHISQISTKHAIELMMNSSPSNHLKNDELIADVQCDAVFLCAVKSHQRRLDLRRDNLGVWFEGHRNPKMPYYNCQKTVDENANTYVWRNNFSCKSYPQLKKIEIYRIARNEDGSAGVILSPMVIAYKFKGKVVPVKVQPHGNTKTSHPFYPATRTLLAELRSTALADSSTSTKIYDKALAAHPTSLAQNMACVPRGVRQIRDLRYTATGSSNPCSSVHEKLMATMESEKNSGEMYIRRIVTDSNNYSIILYTDHMVNFILKKCTTDAVRTAFSPIHAVTTYCLTDMLALVCTMKATEFISDPIIVGPILLTKRQPSKDLTVLWEQIINTEQRLKNARVVFVTSGDEDLIQSISDSFNSSHQFRCRSHIYDIIENNLAQKCIPSTVSVLEDAKCMFTCKEEEFTQKISNTYKRWFQQAKAAGLNKTAMENFVQYFKRVVEPVISANLDEMVENSGLNCNDVESSPAESVSTMLQRWCKGTQAVDAQCKALKAGVMAQFLELNKGFRGLSQKFVAKTQQHHLHTPNDLFNEPDEHDATIDSVDGSDTDVGVQERLLNALKKYYSTDLIINSLIQQAQECSVVAAGSTLVIVEHSNKEMCVNVDQPNCSCDTFLSIKICCHFISAMMNRSDETVNRYIESLRTCTSLPLTGPSNSVVKGSKQRKGG